MASRIISDWEMELSNAPFLPTCDDTAHGSEQQFEAKGRCARESHWVIAEAHRYLSSATAEISATSSGDASRRVGHPIPLVPQRNCRSSPSFRDIRSSSDLRSPTNRIRRRCSPRSASKTFTCSFPILPTDWSSRTTVKFAFGLKRRNSKAVGSTVAGDIDQRCFGLKILSVDMIKVLSVVKAGEIAVAAPSGYVCLWYGCRGHG